MEANRGQNGIQLLLAVEQEAQHIVNAARNGKHVFPSLCF
jgi:V-type H+-transporting ATPase subunit G